MKRTIASLLCLCALCCAFAFAACGKGEALRGEMTLVIDDPQTEGYDAEFTVDLSAFESSDRAIDVLDALSDAGKLCYRSTSGAYGAFLTAVGVMRDGAEELLLTQDEGAGVYLMLCTSVDRDRADYAGMLVAEYRGKTLAESALGISSAHIEDGAVLMITTVTY